jgi:hypothetical protein
MVESRAFGAAQAMCAPRSGSSCYGLAVGINVITIIDTFLDKRGGRRGPSVFLEEDPQRHLATERNQATLREGADRTGAQSPRR